MESSRLSRRGAFVALTLGATRHVQLGRVSHFLAKINAVVCGEECMHSTDAQLWRSRA